MNTQALTRERRLLAMLRMISISSRAMGSRARRSIAQLLAEPVVGNPLHEAWTADGEPVERLSPAARANRAPRFSAINGHSR